MKMVISFINNLEVNAFAGYLEYLFHDYDVKDDIIYTNIDGIEYSKNAREVQLIIKNTSITIKFDNIKSILINN